MKNVKRKICSFALAALLLAINFPALAQQGRKSSVSGSIIVRGSLEAVPARAEQRGWSEGKNITIEHRFAEGKSERLPELAADLVRRKVDLIVVVGAGPAAAAKKATTTIPI